MAALVTFFKNTVCALLLVCGTFNLEAMEGEVIIISDFALDENPEQLNAPNTNMLARAILEERCPIVVSIGLLLNLNDRATHFLNALSGKPISDGYANLIRQSPKARDEFNKNRPSIATIKKLYAESAQRIHECITASKNLEKQEDPCAYYSQELQKIPQKIQSPSVYHSCAWDALAAECLVRPEDWDIYSSPHGFVLMIPKKYLYKREAFIGNEIKKIRKNIEKTFPTANESAFERSILTGFNFISEKIEWHATPYADLIKDPEIDEVKFPEGHTKLGEIFFGIPEYTRVNNVALLEIFELLPQWTIIVAGHGSFTPKIKRVAGMSFESFENLLKHINSHTKTHFLAYKTCYASGISQGYFDKITVAVDLKFAIVSDAVSDTSSIGLDFLPITKPGTIDCLLPAHARFGLPLEKNGLGTCFDLLTQARQKTGDSFEKEIEKILNTAEKIRASGIKADQTTFIKNLSPHHPQLASVVEPFISQKQNHAEFIALLTEFLKTYPPAQKKTPSRDSIIAEALESLFGMWDRQVFKILNPRSSWKTIRARPTETLYTGKEVVKISKLPLGQAFTYTIAYSPQKGFSVQRASEFKSKSPSPKISPRSGIMRAVIEETVTESLDFGDSENIRLYSTISKDKKTVEGFTAHIIQEIKAPKVNVEDLLEGFTETLEYLKTPQAFLIKSAFLSPNLSLNNLIVVLSPGNTTEAPIANLLYEHKGKFIVVTIEIVDHKPELEIDRNVKKSSGIYQLYATLLKKMNDLFNEIGHQKNIEAPTNIEKIPHYQKLLAEFDLREKEGSADAWLAQRTEEERDFLKIMRPKPTLQTKDSNKN